MHLLVADWTKASGYFIRDQCLSHVKHIRVLFCPPVIAEIAYIMKRKPEFVLCPVGPEKSLLAIPGIDRQENNISGAISEFVREE